LSAVPAKAPGGKIGSDVDMGETPAAEFVVEDNSSFRSSGRVDATTCCDPTIGRAAASVCRTAQVTGADAVAGVATVFAAAA